MGWEPFDTWPGGAGGGAFRGRSEPVEAERDGLSGLERLQLFFQSSPDFPDKRVVRRAVLTPSHLYAARMDGTEARVARTALRGVRHVGRLTVLGVVDDEDVLLPRRVGCPLQDALVLQLGEQPPIHIPFARVLGFVMTLVTSLIAATVFSEYSYATWRRHWGMGLTTSESSLGFYAGLALCGLALLFFLWIPSRLVIDQTGVTRRRGLLPWMSFHYPPEKFSGVKVATVWGHDNRRGRYAAGKAVLLTFRRPMRFGSFFPHTRTRLKNFGHEVSLSGDYEAGLLAQRVSTLLAIPRQADG
jgi:hypothetical protein